MIPDDLREAAVCIWGLGLMGSSMAMAIKPHCSSVVGIDSNPEVVAKAPARGVVSEAATNPKDILTGVDILVLAVPVGAILDIIPQLPALCAQPIVVLDIGSTKADIVDVYRSLPEHIFPVGGHPMCGKSVLGLDNADPALFQDAPFMLFPLAHSLGQAYDLVVEMVKAIGAAPIQIQPEVHDHWVAATSHLPYVVASALALSVPEDAAPMIGSGFTSTSRLAETPTSMMLDVLDTNRDNLLAVIREFQTHLDEVADLLKEGDLDGLEDLLDHAAAMRAQMIAESGGGRK